MLNHLLTSDKENFYTHKEHFQTQLTHGHYMVKTYQQTVQQQ